MIPTKLEIFQQKRLEEIGKYLRQVRQSKSISLEQIKEHTKIQHYQLAAIEAGNLSKLPPAVYVRGFIKIYADFLGCQGTELAFTFPIEEAALSVGGSLDTRTHETLQH